MRTSDGYVECSDCGNLHDELDVVAMPAFNGPWWRVLCRDCAVSDLPELLDGPCS